MAKRKKRTRLRHTHRKERVIEAFHTSIPTRDGLIEVSTIVREAGRLEDDEFPEGAYAPVFRQVTYRGDRTTWPQLPAEPQDDKVPAGCSAATYILIRRLFSPRLLDDGPCCARVNGHWVTPDYELLNGDDIVITRYVRGRQAVDKLPH